jgi:hypothetical protein
MKGRIYCIKGSERLILKYLIENKLAPSNTLLFLKILADKKAVSTLELRLEGFDTPELNWFEDKLSKESSILKVCKVENYTVFYRKNEHLEEWKCKQLKKCKSLEAQEWKNRQEKGRYLEDVVGAFYSLKGFKISKRKWFVTPISKERLEVDVLASMDFFPDAEHKKSILICVQCKAWQNCPQGKEHVLNATGVSIWSSKVKEMFPNALIDFWSYHISDYFFKHPSFFRANPTIRFFSTKEIGQAFELVQKERPEMLEKNKVRQEVKIDAKKM